MHKYVQDYGPFFRDLVHPPRQPLIKLSRMLLSSTLRNLCCERMTRSKLSHSTNLELSVCSTRTFDFYCFMSLYIEEQHALINLFYHLTDVVGKIQYVQGSLRCNHCDNPNVTGVIK